MEFVLMIVAMDTIMIVNISAYVFKYIFNKKNVFQTVQFAQIIWHACNAK
jgi:hypothetical protein